MRLKVIFKLLFWLQVAAIPFGAVIYVFFGMAVIASWSAQPTPQALQETLRGVTIVAVTLIVIASPWLAAEIVQSRRKRTWPARLLCSFGSGVAALWGGLGATATFNAGGLFQSLLWIFYAFSHLSIVIFINRRLYA